MMPRKYATCDESDVVGGSRAGPIHQIRSNVFPYRGPGSVGPQSSVALVIGPKTFVSGCDPIGRLTDVLVGNPG